jgi:nicotinic acid mononucleotide adenylyltransferase
LKTHIFHFVTPSSSSRSDGEKSSVKVGTADLLDMLSGEEPGVDFSFALGADTFMDLTAFKWRRSHDVLDLLGGRLVVIYRPTERDESTRYCETDLQRRIDAVNRERRGMDAQEGCEASADGPAMLLKPDLEAISSSLARSTADEAELEMLLEPKVVQYIKQKQFYGFAN